MNLKKISNYANENYTSYYRKFSIDTKNRLLDYKPLDDLKLFRLEDEFAKITLPLLLEFENRMNKVCIDYLSEKNLPRNFYLDQTYFKNAFSSYSPPRISKCWIFYKKVIKKLQVSGKIQSNYSCGNNFNLDISILQNHGFDIVSFYISIGSFFTVLSNMKYMHLGDFADKFVKSTANNFDDHTFFKFMINLRYLRNRLAHTNHCLSKYLENEMSEITDIDNTENLYNIFSSKLSKSVLFMLNNISYQRRNYYSKKYFVWLVKNKNVINKYSAFTNLENDLVKKAVNAKKCFKKI